MSGSTLLLRLGGAHVRVRIEGDNMLRRRFSSFYSHALPTAGKPQVLLRWINGRGEVRWRGYLTARSRDPEALCAWAEWAAAGEALKRLRPRGLLLHAAWAAKDRASVLLAGGHGLGKTTLAAALALRHGWRILADDMVVLNEQGRPRAIERPVRIKPGGRRVLSELDPGAYSLSRFGASRPIPSLSAVLLLEGPGSRLRRSRLDQGMAVARMGQLAFNLAVRPQRFLATLARVAGSVPVFELRGGNLGNRCRAVRELLQA
jgi:hypothetical protein